VCSSDLEYTNLKIVADRGRNYSLEINKI